MDTRETLSMDHLSTLLDRVRRSEVFQDLYRRQARGCEEHARRLQRGVSSHVTDGPTTWPLVPMLVRSARDGRIVDWDGNEYVDLSLGMGALILGHSPQVVREAVQAALEQGLAIGLAQQYETRLAELLLEHVACAEMAYLCSTGTEATMQALKLARAYRRRPKVAKIAAHYHGHHNDLLPGYFGPGAPNGVPESVLESTLVLPFDLSACEVIERHADELACVIVEPITSAWPVPDLEVLRALRETTARRGVVLVFDEVVVGFRTRFGAALDPLGIVPDMATFGKIIGGGFPVAAVVGRGEILATGRSSGHPLRDQRERVPILGTFNGSAVCCAAGVAQLEHLRANQHQLYAALEQRAAAAHEAIASLVAEERLPFCVARYGTIFTVQAVRDRPRHVAELFQTRHVVAQYLLSYYLRHAGVYLREFGGPFIGAAHDDRDLAQIIAAYGAALRGLRRDGVL